MKVSVCTITYDHEKYIAQAIESVLMQQTQYSFEMVIGEDASSDRTREICVEYQKRYPCKIRLLLRGKNIGMMENFVQTLQECPGEYIALLEGDDYWTAFDKLEKQVAFLDAHPKFAICSHNVLLGEDGGVSAEWLGREHREVSTVEDLLRDGSGGATCSLVFRKSAALSLPEWYSQMPGGDWTLQTLCATRGKMRYFREVMGVHRIHDGGAVYAAIEAAKRRGEDTVAIPSRNSLAMCDALGRHFAGKYACALRRQRAYWHWMGAMEFLQCGRRRQAQRYMFAALPGLIPLPKWLTLRELFRGLFHSFCSW